MNKRLLTPLLFIPLIIGVFFYQFFLLGKLPIPADTISGLYHPMRDFYSSEYPNGMTFKNFLITDPVRQQYPWRHLSIESFKSLELPLWNPYSSAGTPLVANFQTGAFYPLNIVFLILPFEYAWSILVISQPLLGGFFLYLFLRNLKLEKGAALLGGVTFAFSGFSIAWMQWNTLSHVALWLPLILLSKDKIIEKLSIKWVVILIFAEVSAILAGHLQTLFYLWIVSTSYLLLKVFYSNRNMTLRISIKKSLKRLAIFLPIFFIILFLTLPQWLLTLQFINESARSLDQVDWHSPGWFIPWFHMIQFIIPDFFGNPTTLNYWGTWNYAELIGYVGVLPLILALFAIFIRRDRKTLFFTVVLALSVIFSYHNFISELPFRLTIPFISTSQPTRLLFLVDFALAVLASLGLDQYQKKKSKKIFILLLIPFIVLSVIWAFFLFKIEINQLLTQNYTVVGSNIILPTIILVTLSILLIIHFFARNNYKKIIIICLILVTIFDLMRFGLKFLPFTQKNYLYPPTKSTEFLRSDKDTFRIMSTNSEILPPNFSVMYGIQSVDGYDPLYLKRYGEFISMMESGTGQIPHALSFNRIITPHNYNSQLIDFLNVKYILSFDEIREEKYMKVFQEGKTKIYENSEVQKRAFFIKNIVWAEDKSEAATLLFKVNLKDTAILEEPKSNRWDLYCPCSVGKAEIKEYTSNRVVIETENIETGLLVLSDTYYDSWKVILSSENLNGQKVNYQSKINRTNYNFRSVVVPKGKFTVTMYSSIL